MPKLSELSRDQLLTARSNAQEQGNQVWVDKIDARLSAMPEPEGPTVSEIAAGIGAEVGIGAGSQMLGGALAPLTMGISYPVLAFIGGFAGSASAQKIEGVEKQSLGRNLVGGLTNLIPGASVGKPILRKAGQELVETGAKALSKEAAKKIATREVVKAATTQAGLGAGTGVGQATAMAVIDEGRLPTMDELATYGLSGAAFGTVLGTAFQSPGAINSYRKIAGKSAKEIDDMIAKGLVNPGDWKLREDVGGDDANDVRAVARKINDGIDTAISASEQSHEIGIATSSKASVLDSVKEWGRKEVTRFAPSKSLGERSNRAIQTYKNEIRASEELASQLGTKIDKKIKSVSRAHPDAKNTLESFLNGKIDDLPDYLRDIELDVRLAREQIAELQGKVLKQIDLDLIATKNPEELVKLRKTIQTSLDSGDYLTREYRFFTDKNYKPTTQQREAARAELMSKHMARGATPEVARADADKTLARWDAMKLKDTANQRYYPSAIDGVLRRKHDIGDASRAYLGEIIDVGERVRGTISRVARMAYRNETDDAIRRHMVDAGIATPEPQGDMIELSLKSPRPDGERLYVHPSVQTALNNTYLGMDDFQIPYVLQPFWDVFQSAISVSKATKVLLNPPSYAVQLWGNTANLLGMGANIFKGLPRAARLSSSDVPVVKHIASLITDSASKNQVMREMNEMARYGLRGVNILESDIRNAVQGGKLSKVTEKILDPFGKAYSVPDTMGRYVAWKNNQDSLRNIFPGASSDTIKRVAADMTNNTYQNYDRLSKSVKLLSRFGLMGQFASFSAEFARNQYHQARIIKQMMSGQFGSQYGGLGKIDPEEMMKEGSKRLASIMLVYGGMAGTLDALRKGNGVDDKTYQALKETVVPEYDQHLELAVARDGDTVKYANPSYLVPHAIGLSAIQAAFSDQPIDALADVVVGEFGGEGTFVGRALSQAVSNRDAYGRPISTSEESRKMDLFKYFMRESFRPGFMREYDKLEKAVRGAGDLTIGDISARQAGYRVNSLTIPESARYRIAKEATNIRESTKRYNSAINPNRELSPQQIEAEYQRSNSDRQEAIGRVRRHNQNLATLGYNESQRIAILKDSGLSSRDVLSVMTGIDINLRRDRKITSSILWDEQLAGKSRDEQMASIRAIAKDDPSMGRKLMNRMRSEEKQRRSGVSDMDALILNLDPDGERAMFLSNMVDKRSPNAKIREWQRKGLVTPEIAQQILLLLQ